MATVKSRKTQRSLTCELYRGSNYSDRGDKSQSSRHIPCAFHLESKQLYMSGRHDGACLPLLSAVTIQGWNSVLSTNFRPVRQSGGGTLTPPVFAVRTGPSPSQIEFEENQFLSIHWWNCWSSLPLLESWLVYYYRPFNLHEKLHGE